MPVLPEVGSMMVEPGLSLPLVSASSIMESAMRSLIDPPGLARSDLIHTWCEVPNSRLMRMCGVSPMVESMLLAFKEAPSGESEGDRGDCGTRRAAALRCRQHLHQSVPVSYTHLRAHETRHDLVCR